MRRTLLLVVAVVLITATIGSFSAAVAVAPVGSVLRTDIESAGRTQAEADADEAALSRLLDVFSDKSRTREERAGICDILQDRTGVDVCGVIDGCAPQVCAALDLVNCPDLDPTVWSYCYPEIITPGVHELVSTPDLPAIPLIPDLGGVNNTVEGVTPVEVDADDHPPAHRVTCNAVADAPHMEESSTSTIVGRGHFRCPGKQSMRIDIKLKVRIADVWYLVTDSMDNKYGDTDFLAIRTEAACTQGSFKYRTVVQGLSLHQGDDIAKSASDSELPCRPNTPPPLRDEAS